MRLPALSRRFVDLATSGEQSPTYLLHAARILFLVLGFLLFSLFTPLRASAQVSPPSNLAQPNIDSNVSPNQHVLVQAITIEVLSSLICQVAGVDVMDPQTGCLQVNPATKKLGYAQNGQQLGGLLGMGTVMISSLYVQPASGVSYIRNLASNFGVVKRSYAQICIPTCDPPDQQAITGFEALAPVQKLWVAVRNITYIFFILIFVILGIAIMLRYKIDGHGHGPSVMNIQNQLPKIVVALILISFSYAIVGLVIDFMWVTTYFGINVLTSADNPDTANCENVTDDKKVDPIYVSEKATGNILNFPLAFLNDVFAKQHCGFIANIADKESADGIMNSGVANLSYSVGSAMGSVVKDVFETLVNPDAYGSCNIKSAAGDVVKDALFKGLPFYKTHDDNFSIRACAIGAFFGIVQVVLSLLGTLIAFCAIVIAMFRLWWALLKAYAYIVIFTIIGPLFILVGLIPGSHHGFSSWLRKIVANLAVFPAAAMLIVTSRVVLDLYDKSTNSFVTPFIGNPFAGVMGPLLAFGLLMLGPELVNLVRNALGAPSGQLGGVVQGGLVAGIGPGMYPVRQPWNRLWGQGGHGENAGWLRKNLVGVGADANRRQRLVRSLGIAGGYHSNWQAPNRAPTGGGGGGGGHTP